MEVENGHVSPPAENGSAAAAPLPEPPAEALPEVEAYTYLLALMYLLDRKQHEEVLMRLATHIQPTWHAPPVLNCFSLPRS